MKPYAHFSIAVEENTFVVKVPLKNVTENVTENRKNLIINEMGLNNLISIDQLAEKLNVTRRTIIRDIDKLKTLKIIKRIGPDKGGHWQLLKHLEKYKRQK